MTESTPHTLTVQFEVVPADPNYADPALIGEVARDVAASLRAEGYSVQPAYTGTRGASIFDVFQQIGQNAIDNKELLTSLFTLGVPVAEALKSRLEKLKAPTTKEDPLVAQPIKITYTIDGAIMTIEAPDAASAAQLVDQFRAQHPTAAAQITSTSSLKISGTVAPKSTRRRR